ncbi:hypothetical protein ACO2Q9_06640 [Variovorax sp. VNK109]|uniref:hypothetical protein n=1 Tax=Variovorax sp. VNK109 TaxID=3400919 RepID=UPI003C02C779
MNKTLKKLVVRAALVASLVVGVAAPARAQSEASVALSMLPVASVVGAASVGGAALSAAPVVLSAAGTMLTVKAIGSSARGSVYVLERASDGARISIETVGRGVGASVAGVGTVVTVSVIGTGIVLSAASEVLAYIPNELGRALLHNERVTW